jgi:hypothetical protein
MPPKIKRNKMIETIANSTVAAPSRMAERE